MNKTAILFLSMWLCTSAMAQTTVPPATANTNPFTRNMQVPDLEASPATLPTVAPELQNTAQDMASKLVLVGTKGEEVMLRLTDGKNPRLLVLRNGDTLRINGRALQIQLSGNAENRSVSLIAGKTVIHELTRESATLAVRQVVVTSSGNTSTSSATTPAPAQGASTAAPATPGPTGLMGHPAPMK